MQTIFYSKGSKFAALPSYYPLFGYNKNTTVLVLNKRILISHNYCMLGFNFAISDNSLICVSTNRVYIHFMSKRIKTRRKGINYMNNYSTWENFTSNIRCSSACKCKVSITCFTSTNVQ